MQLVSVNVSRPRTIDLGGRTFLTAIAKHPVTGPVAVEELGLGGDEVASTEHHGGIDQAVYLYGVDDYRWWDDRLDRDAPLPPAIFGENLTIDGLCPADVRVGSRFGFDGGVELEATGGRVPCSKLAGRMGDPSFPERFVAAGRTGVHTRVVETGRVASGEPVVFQQGDMTAPTTTDVVRLFFDRDVDRPTLEWLLSHPISLRARDEFARRLARLD